MWNAAESLLVHTVPRLERVVLTDPLCVTGFAAGKDAWDDLQGALDKVDFVMACESIHWTELEPTMRTLPAGCGLAGPLPPCSTGPFPSITNNGAASDAFQRLIAHHVDGGDVQRFYLTAARRGHGSSTPKRSSGTPRP
ncbi:hypothetical protein INS49_005228 [Diaporthe citri]|uniref:uncharacterized protein n=1 Tax=Diaporthe citri TaxID=83186 RepID=UPI001C7EA3ED|nr:uncharacterized protein INS49_005228 [Diaporthe citri]KAG6353970.1 hypothetical protein INS49_005228 [Diaporthe citri]